MTVFYRTVVTGVGVDVADLLEGGMLILFAEGAPPELAEVSVLHRVAESASPEAPPPGAIITIGSIQASLTAIGGLAWNKMADIGHVVINFNGATASERPGEINAANVPVADLHEALQVGCAITIAG